MTTQKKFAIATLVSSILFFFSTIATLVYDINLINSEQSNVFSVVYDCIDLCLLLSGGIFFAILLSKPEKEWNKMRTSLCVFAVILFFGSLISGILAYMTIKYTFEKSSIKNIFEEKITNQAQNSSDEEAPIYVVPKEELNQSSENLDKEVQERCNQIKQKLQTAEYLKNSGQISNEEYENIKQEILNKLK